MTFRDNKERVSSQQTNKAKKAIEYLLVIAYSTKAVIRNYPIMTEDMMLAKK